MKTAKLAEGFTVKTDREWDARFNDVQMEYGAFENARIFRPHLMLAITALVLSVAAAVAAVWSVAEVLTR